MGRPVLKRACPGATGSKALASFSVAGSCTLGLPDTGRRAEQAPGLGSPPRLPACSLKNLASAAFSGSFPAKTMQGSCQRRCLWQSISKLHSSPSMEGQGGVCGLPFLTCSCRALAQKQPPTCCFQWLASTTENRAHADTAGLRVS